MGVALVLRDHSGQLLAARRATLPYISDPTIAEALAVTQGLQLCRDLGVQRIIVEGDSLEIISAIQRDSGWELVLEVFQSWELVFIRRMATNLLTFSHGWL